MQPARPSKWRPSEAERSGLLSFEGYGSDHPSVVFVGIDEYCEAGDEHQRDLIYRRSTSEVFAAKRASKNAALGVLYPELRRSEVTVWQIAAAVMHHLREQLGAQPKSVEHELALLGERDGDSLLTELLPLPRNGTKDFPPYIADWFPFGTCGQYVRAMLGPDPWSRRKRPVPGTGLRVPLLRQIAGAPATKFVVCYGPGWWRVHDTIFGSTTWKTVSTTATNIPTIKVGRLPSGAKIALTGFFGTPPRGFFAGSAMTLAKALAGA